jgi:hypothetical protein
VTIDQREYLEMIVDVLIVGPSVKSALAEIDRLTAERRQLIDRWPESGSSKTPVLYGFSSDDKWRLETISGNPWRDGEGPYESRDDAVLAAAGIGPVVPTDD